MKWRSIKIIILCLLLFFNAAFLVLRLCISASERREKKEALASALQLCEQRGIDNKITDFSLLESVYSYYVLGAKNETFFSTGDKTPVTIALSEDLAGKFAEQCMKENLPQYGFSLIEKEKTDHGWEITYCREEKGIRFLHDEVNAVVEQSGKVYLEVVRWDIVEKEKQSLNDTAGSLLAQALQKVEKQGVSVRSLDEVYIAYKTEKEDRKNFSVPYAVFVFTLNNGSRYEVHVRTGER